MAKVKPSVIILEQLLEINTMKTTRKHIADRAKSLKVANDKAARVKRMEVYMQSTHQVFLSNLQRAEQLQVLGNGVLAGPVAKRVGCAG